jgi:hypothetical protein
MGWSAIRRTLEKPQYVILIIALVYVPIAYYGVRTVSPISDEHLYYYMAYAITQGQRPYVDFFCAHMPLMIYPLAFLYKLFGPSIELGKLVPIVSSFFVVVFTYLIGERYRKHAGILAGALLMLSPIFHPYLRSMYGLFSCIALGLAALYFQLNGRKFLSGFCIVLSLFVRLNIYPLFLFLMLTNGRNVKFYYGMLAASPLFLFLLTPHFIEDTVIYHLQRTPDSWHVKLSVLEAFVVGQWMPVTLSLAGSLSVYASRRWRGVKDLYQRMTTLDSSLSLVLITALLLVLTVVNKALWVYYFIFLLPFMALIGGIGVLSLPGMKKSRILVVVAPAVLAYIFYSSVGMTSAVHGIAFIALLMLASMFIKKRHAPVIAMGILLCSLYFNQEGIRSAYTSVRLNSYEELVNYITSHTAKGEEIAYIGFGNAYVAMRSQRVLAGNFIDITDEVFFKYRSDIDNAMLASLQKGVRLVIFETRHMSYVTDMQAGLPKTLEYLRSHYIPVEVFYDWEDVGQRRPLVVWSIQPDKPSPTIFERPEGNETRYVFERYYYYTNAKGFTQENFDAKNIDVSQPYIPRSIRGGNIYNLTMIPDDVIHWPVKEGDHYKIDSGNTVSDVWISSTSGGMIRVMVDAHFKNGEIAAFSKILYNYTARRTDYLVSFSRISDRVVDGFIPSYQQIPLTPEEFKELNDISKEVDEQGNIPTDEYMALKIRILPQDNTSKTMELKR